MHSFYAAGAHTYANEYGPPFRSSCACALPFLCLPLWRLPCHTFSTWTVYTLLPVTLWFPIVGGATFRWWPLCILWSFRWACPPASDTCLPSLFLSAWLCISIVTPDWCPSVPHWVQPWTHTSGSGQELPRTGWRVSSMPHRTHLLTHPSIKCVLKTACTPRMGQAQRPCAAQLLPGSHWSYLHPTVADRCWMPLRPVAKGLLAWPCQLPKVCKSGLLFPTSLQLMLFRYIPVRALDRNLPSAIIPK